MNSMLTYNDLDPFVKWVDLEKTIMGLKEEIKKNSKKDIIKEQRDTQTVF